MKTSSDLHKHYSLLLGLIPPWLVTNVDLRMGEKLVEIDVQWPVDHAAECPECGRSCSIEDHREERRWRHLDTMQFQTIIKSRVPRSECPDHGVKTINIVNRRKSKQCIFGTVFIDSHQDYQLMMGVYKDSSKYTLFGLSTIYLVPSIRREVLPAVVLVGDPLSP